MPYNNQLANHIREYIQTNSFCWKAESNPRSQIPRTRNKHEKRFEERQLFGGLAFIVNGKMALAIIRDDILFRNEQIPNHKFDTSMIKLSSSDGKPINGWSLVPKANRQPEAVLSRWIDQSIRSALLPDGVPDQSWNFNETQANADSSPE